MTAVGQFTAGSGYALAAGTDSWINAYAGKSTNAAIADKRSVALIKAHVPPPIVNDVIDTLGGPPEPVLVYENRYVFMAACAWKNCTKKGFFWIDTQLDIGLGGYFSEEGLNIGSTRINAAQLPKKCGALNKKLVAAA